MEQRASDFTQSRDGKLSREHTLRRALDLFDKDLKFDFIMNEDFNADILKATKLVSTSGALSGSQMVLSGDFDISDSSTTGGLPILRKGKAPAHAALLERATSAGATLLGHTSQGPLNHSWLSALDAKGSVKNVRCMERF